MSRSPEFARFSLALLLVLAPVAGAFEGVGRPATPAEVKAWDIDVRPDFQGLPEGSGSVADGEQIWIQKCSSCHGDFGDANHVFPPLVGNTTAQDIETGRVAALAQAGATRTTMMKMPTVSTLWDFIHRAMPWDKPKSLKPDEVYAVVAYMLNLAEVVPADYVLGKDNIAWAQSRMPNRNGMTRDHGLWEIDGKPDTSNRACMKDCRETAEVTSSLPDFARNAHGELQKQNREYGAIRGARTSPEGEAPAAQAAVSKAPNELLSGNGCLGCHGIDARLVGPGFREITAKHQGRADVADYLAGRIRNGGSGVWGAIPMPPQPQLDDEQIQALTRWLLEGAPE